MAPSNVDANLTFLGEIIETIGSGPHHAVDPDLFADRMMDDIMFVEKTLALLRGKISAGVSAFRRSDRIRQLVRTKIRFAEVLEAIARGDHAFDNELEPFNQRFIDTARGQREGTELLVRNLRSVPEVERRATEVVSEQEIRFLLMGERSEERP